MYIRTLTLLVMLASTTCLISYRKKTYDTLDERRIVIVMVTYNAQEYMQRALDSVFSQQYDNYILLMVDDCSTDNTVCYAKQYAKQRGCEQKFVVHKNKVQRTIPLMNYARAINTAREEDIMVILDPQDFFAHDRVLAYINNYYQSHDVWMTYGPVRVYNTNQFMCNKKLPIEVVEFNAYRDYLHVPRELHTFYARLFKIVRTKDFVYEKEFIQMDDCLPAVFPMLEFAGEHARYVPEVLVERDSSLDDTRYTVVESVYDELEMYVRSFRRYDALDSLLADDI